MLRIDNRSLLADITEVRPLDGYRLRLRFEDGVEGVVDVAELIPFDGVFAPLRDRVFFERVSILSLERFTGRMAPTSILRFSIRDLAGTPLPSFEPKTSTR